jgi:DNA-binding CsgD family transcriptional regulator
MWRSVRDFIDESSNHNSLNELSNSMSDLTQAWGFDRFVSAKISSSQNIIQAPLTMAFGNSPEEWFQHYQEHGHVYRDPCIELAMTSNQARWLSAIRSGPLTADQALVMNEAQAFGINNCLVVPSRQPDGSVWASCFFTQSTDQSEEVLISATVAAHQFVEIGARLANKETKQLTHDYILTPRQREVVDLLAQGLNTFEISENLGTSPRTVAHQIEEAKRRLNAPTLPALVVQATLRGEVMLPSN